MRSQVTKERLYSEGKKRGTLGTLGNMKEMVGQQKSTEKWRQQRKGENSLKPHPYLPRVGRGS
jgi:hypothetical protein